MAFPESIGCDAGGKALYASQFGGATLKPAEKEGVGRISKLSLDGKLQESRFLPDSGDTLNKPKGNWIKGNRLWVADIDTVWVFDLKTRKGRKVPIPGAQFANDVALMGNALYVSDNRSDQVFRIEPADFLNAKQAPKVTVVLAGKGVFPNGLYPAKDGSLLMVGFKSAKEPKGIYALSPKGELTELARDLGQLDGVYQAKDGTILATDWITGSLFAWTAKDGMQTLASNFKGPADFCVIPQANGYTVYVPDLVKSELRIIKLGK
ncbi:MAG: hypothetical protein ACREUW_10975 [Burkholderiales bacterium]